ncbi:MAG: hypothetical protein LBL41_04905 [Bifidobacteriaceae bacterium]|jgi:hypothetical protein|nr:hypothetical protein [Bifidobacteriaceae bacterium]
MDDYDDIDVEESMRLSMQNGLTEEEFERGLELTRICAENISAWAKTLVKDPIVVTRVTMEGNEIHVTPEITEDEEIVPDVKMDVLSNQLNEVHDELDDITKRGLNIVHKYDLDSDGHEIVDDSLYAWVNDYVPLMYLVATKDGRVGGFYYAFCDNGEDVECGLCKLAVMPESEITEELCESVREKGMELMSPEFAVKNKKSHLLNRDIDIEASRAVSMENGVSSDDFYLALMLDELRGIKTRDIGRGWEVEDKLNEIFDAGLRFVFKDNDHMSAYERVIKRLNGGGINAKEIRDCAILTEPFISADMKEIAHATGMFFDGFRFRIKSEEAHIRKVILRESQGLQYEGNDEVRYTLLSTSGDDFQLSAQKAIDMLKNMGYETVTFENLYAKTHDGYRVITVVSEHPKSKARFELRLNIEAMTRVHAMYHKVAEVARGDIPISGAHIYENIDVWRSKHASINNGLSERKFDLALMLYRICIDSVDKLGDGIVDKESKVDKELVDATFQEAWTELASLFEQGLTFIDKDCPT